MKHKFSSVDITAEVSCINEKLTGMRVNQIYNIDNYTYLIKLAKSEEKAVLLIESGSRFHTTQYEWPKSPAPSSFSMKMRKHLKNKRLEYIKQLGTDRIVDFMFGSGEVAYHVILELYDRGNIVLTDFEYTIVNILRVRKDDEDVKFMVKEKYPVQKYLKPHNVMGFQEIKATLDESKPSDTVKKVFLPRLVYGPAILEHMLISCGLKSNVKVKDMKEDEIKEFEGSFKLGEGILQQCSESVAKGYIIRKKEGKIMNNGVEEDMYSFQEFHPYLYAQHVNQDCLSFESFDSAIDEFFSKIESQKMDLKTLQKEREALKKLENVKTDHEKRIGELHSVQETNRVKAYLVEINQQLVDRALLVVRSAIANKLSWDDIQELVIEAQDRGDATAKAISKLKLEENHIVMNLSDPYEVDGDGTVFYHVDIDLDLSAFANAERLYGITRHAVVKEKRTIESSNKAYKSAQLKTKQTLKEAAVMASINKARKTLWFEKFFWFISSENYLVIGGRDHQQNELLVKKYLQKNDIYVHADIHGASSIVIKNPSPKDPVPAKTLNEAGVMALCYSVSWEAKVVTACWWVHAHQVSKTAPTGAYLTTGSFMIRGKKNYLPPASLVMGFGFMFHLAESSISNHANERQNKLQDTGSEDINENEEEEKEVDLADGSDGSSDSDDKDGVSRVQETAPVVTENHDNDEERHSPETGLAPDEMEFPDTELKIEITAGDQVTVKATPVSKTFPESANTQKNVVYLGDDKPVTVREACRSRQRPHLSSQSSRSHKDSQSDSKDVNTITSTAPPAKRGQRGKIKKMKKKYKDQDEEERQLRMEVLKSSGNQEKQKKKNKDKVVGNAQDVAKGKAVKKLQREEDIRLLSEEDFVDVPDHLKMKEPIEDDDDDDEEHREENQQDSILSSLTGNPLPEDELIFALPICAPYSVMTNYKYKVKLIPGTTKRGKATKAALNMFLSDKTASPHEKDLLKSNKDQDLARNFPGKVKVSGQMLHKK